MYTDIHRKGGGGASIVVISLWSENSAKLAVFYVHGYVAGGFPSLQTRVTSVNTLRGGGCGFLKCDPSYLPLLDTLSPVGRSGLCHVLGRQLQGPHVHRSVLPARLVVC